MTFAVSERVEDIAATVTVVVVVLVAGLGVLIRIGRQIRHQDHKSDDPR